MLAWGGGGTAIYWLFGYVPRKGHGFQAIWSGIGSTKARLFLLIEELGAKMA